MSAANAHRGGSVRDALRVPRFRLMFCAAFGSGLGTWIQNVVLPIYVYDRTKSASAVAIMAFAQLGPYLFFSVPAAAFVDRYSRKSWIASTQLTMLVFSCFLAWGAAVEAPLWLIFFAQLGVGIGNAMDRPAWTAMLPTLVAANNVAGAAALNGVVINASRIVGPLIVAVAAPLGPEAWHFFLGNAVTYCFVIWAVLVVKLPVNPVSIARPWLNFVSAVTIIRSRRPIARLFQTIVLFSAICLTYIGLLPAVTSRIFGIEGATAMYKWLYAVWATGAGLGGLAIGTFLGKSDMRRALQIGLGVTAIGLSILGFGSGVPVAFGGFFVVGFGYFLATTAMTAVLQTYLEVEQRGRVLAIWFMSFGGVVPIGTLIFAPLVDAYGARWLMVLGACVAVFLTFWCDLIALERVKEAR